jgi:hypothetical protein
MGFATVKSDPWKKGLTPRRRRRGLWSGAQWKRLCETAKREYGFRWESPNLAKYPIGPDCFAAIAVFNGVTI